MLEGEYWGLGSESGVGEVGVGEHKKKRGKAFDLTSNGNELPCCVLCVTHEYVMWRILATIKWCHSFCTPVPLSHLSR